MSDPPVIVRSSAVLSRAGNAFTLLAALWFVTTLVWAGPLASAIGIGRLPDLVRLLIAVGPSLVSLAAGPLGRRFVAFRWLLAQPQPSATIDEDGMEICLPDAGCRRFAWEQVGGLRPVRLIGLRRFTTRFEPYELVATDGRPLVEIPFVLALPASELHWRSVRTLAEIVVGRRRDRYALLRPPHLLASHLTFGLIKDAPSAAEMEAIDRRARVLKRLLYGGLLIASVVGFLLVSFRF